MVDVAQLAEHQVVALSVVGSRPIIHLMMACSQAAEGTGL